MTRPRCNQLRKAEAGATLLEFSIAATVFFMALFGVLEVSRLFWVHNVLTEAVRNGSRYAVLHQKTQQSITDVTALIVYGTVSPAQGAQAVVPGLTTNMVTVTYSNDFGVKLGTATVTITGYVFNFSVPLIGSTVSMPTYKSTMTGESAGR